MGTRQGRRGARRNAAVCDARGHRYPASKGWGGGFQSGGAARRGGRAFGVSLIVGAVVAEAVCDVRDWVLGCHDGGSARRGGQAGKAEVGHGDSVENVG